jgi:hypothetical protein
MTKGDEDAINKAFNVIKEFIAAKIIVPQFGDKPVIRIALSGAPCSGKSEFLHMVDQLKQKLCFGIYLTLVPEAATLLFENGGLPGKLTNEGQAEQQVLLAETAVNLENNLREQAQLHCRGLDDVKLIVQVVDRPVPDVLAFIDDDDVLQRFWAKLEADKPEVWSAMTDPLRYDAVFSLITVAQAKGCEIEKSLLKNAHVIKNSHGENSLGDMHEDGDSLVSDSDYTQYYSWAESAVSTNKQRYHSPAMAWGCVKPHLAVYKDHHKHFIVGNNFNSGQEKASAVINALFMMFNVNLKLVF